MGYGHIEIKTKGEPPSIFTEIYIDGHLIPGVRNYRLLHEVGNEIPTLTLDLNALDLSVDASFVKYNQRGMRDFSFKWEEDANDRQRNKDSKNT